MDLSDEVGPINKLAEILNRQANENKDFNFTINPYYNFLPK